MIQWIGFPITIILALSWLVVCILLAALSLIIPRRSKEIDLSEVKNKNTICRYLNEKGRLTDEEYSFETENVASFYDYFTFKGYLFIVSPLLFLMKVLSRFEDLMLWLVYQWIKAHKKIFSELNIHTHTLNDKLEPVPTYTTVITYICVRIAQGVGVTLHSFQSFLTLFRLARKDH